MILAINRPVVSSEVIDGEAIVINLENGSYYSMDGLAAELWRCIECNGSKAQMLGAMQARFADQQVNLTSDLERFVTGLLDERLVVVSEPGVGAEGDAGAGEPFEFHFPAGSYQAPGWTKYDDMQDLLVLDPIHEVDDKGWPSVG